LRDGRAPSTQVVTIEASLTCDGCAHIIVAASSPAKARREFREMGGKVTRRGDFCRECVESGRAERVDEGHDE
jgi:hypothetical protein